jgi:hypothetical protein
MSTMFSHKGEKPDKDEKPDKQAAIEQWRRATQTEFERLKRAVVD